MLVVALVVGFSVSAAPTARLRSVPLRSMVNAKPAAKKATQPASSSRQVAAKATEANLLENMEGAVYDNIVFRTPGGWDPAAMSKGADIGKLNRFRDSELFHGRLGMMAVLGQLVAEKYHPFVPDATGTAWEQFQFAINKNPVHTHAPKYPKQQKRRCWCMYMHHRQRHSG
mmetsp:Transcript_30049/g.58790  ORF Transcript_30049/g.58790 Transcript_30049/m.58790 type:complete len:171 (-) Transcript_30049:753-1265(-)